ncbi:avidin/streptavidin family protein [Variovorax sp. J22R133]|uniref:avidin/streptavidin family protein n=1 Tax=Variovorax brevis TaxID=3053503 RepID=UPI002577EDB4|nr:avidin/streptavidin family protein [Variovorax sp. J22R133]MDM0113509.1 avidin/streptavidin family protein [Variovorax sp. J22R133]
MSIRTGRWLGRNGGGLEILAVAPGGHVSARYQTKVGKPNPNAWFDAHGMTDGRLIGFTVLWQNSTEQHGSLATFTGRYLGAGDADGFGDSARERIEAQWHLARLFDDDDPGKPHAMWETFLTNATVLYWTP